jgi:hypothetical protein
MTELFTTELGCEKVLFGFSQLSSVVKKPCFGGFSQPSSVVKKRNQIKTRL